MMSGLRLMCFVCQKLDFLGCQKDSSQPDPPRWRVMHAFQPRVVCLFFPRTFHLMQICDVAFDQCNTAVAYDEYLNQYAACLKTTGLHPTTGKATGGVGELVGKGWCFCCRLKETDAKHFKAYPKQTASAIKSCVH